MLNANETIDHKDIGNQLILDFEEELKKVSFFNQKPQNNQNNEDSDTISEYRAYDNDIIII